MFLYKNFTKQMFLCQYFEVKFLEKHSDLFNILSEGDIGRKDGDDNKGDGNGVDVEVEVEVEVDLDANRRYIGREDGEDGEGVGSKRDLD